MEDLNIKYKYTTIGAKTDIEKFEVVFNIKYDCFIFLKIRYDKTEKYIREKKISAANNFYIMNDIFEYTFNSVTDEEVFDNFNIETEINNSDSVK